MYIYLGKIFLILIFPDLCKVELLGSNGIAVPNYSAESCSGFRLSSYLRQLYWYEFAKIKFRGKGYKIRKSSCKSIFLQFNRAHITTLW